MKGISSRKAIEELENPAGRHIFKAMKGDHAVAQSRNLKELAKKLEEMKIDPRTVRIISSKKAAPVVKTRLRRKWSTNIV